VGRSPFGGGGGPPGAGGGGETKKGGEASGKKGEGKKGGGEAVKNGAEKKGKGEGDMMAGMQAAGRSMQANPPAPSWKDRLVSLVTKLDLLTSKTPVLNLTDDQKVKIREKLKALDKEEISNEEAEKMLEDILEIVEGDRKYLEMAGFQYPGAGGAISRPHPNPFKTSINAQHLKALQEHLSEKGNK
jgi:hypothetical protein